MRRVGSRIAISDFGHRAASTEAISMIILSDSGREMRDLISGCGIKRVCPCTM